MGGLLDHTSPLWVSRWNDDGAGDGGGNRDQFFEMRRRAADVDISNLVFTVVRLFCTLCFLFTFRLCLFFKPRIMP